MELNNSVKVLERTRVAPYSDSATITEFTLPVISFDAYWLRFPPVERLFFYQLDIETESDSAKHQYFISVILPKLKHSLSLTLLHYLPLAGHLTWPSHADRPTISYTPDDAVSFIVAESSANFPCLSGGGIIESTELHPFVPELFTSDEKASSVALQITFFSKESGFCIGITAHHAVLDGLTSMKFMKSWAYLCEQIVVGQEPSSTLPLELTPSFDRTVIEDRDELYFLFLKRWLGSDPTDPRNRSLKILPSLGFNHNHSVRATFELNPDHIKKLKEKLWNIFLKANKEKQVHLSIFVLSYAYVSVCLVKATSGERNRNVNVLFPVDYRSRLEPPVPENYFGNCINIHKITLKASDLTEADGIAFTAEKLGETIKGIGKGQKLYKDARERLENLMTEEEGDQSISIAGSTRFKFYELDFGWGRPKKVETVSIDKTGAVSMMESRDGGGVEFGVVVEKTESMEVFASLFADGLKTI